MSYKETAFWILLVMALIMLAGNGKAQNEDPDQIGVYFDYQHTTNSIFPEPGQPFYAYVWITNPSQENMQSFEFKMLFDPPLGSAVNIISVTSLYTYGVYYLYEIAEHLEIGFTIVDGLGAPGVGHIVVVGLVASSASQCNIYIGPVTAQQPLIPGHAAYTGPGHITPLHPVGGISNPVAVINGDSPIAYASATWGQVKNQYR